MTIGPSEADAIGREGYQALQRGDAAAARRAFERLIETKRGGPQAHLFLAEACRIAGDAAGEAAALDAMLAADPHSIPALIMRGDLCGRGGDRRAATSFYQAALAAARQAEQLPRSLAAQLERVQSLVAASAGEFQAHLEADLKARHIDPEAAGPRFAEGLDILFGRKQIYLQQPSVFYFPGLPQTQFYDAGPFEWAAELEAATGEIRAELLALVEEGGGFRPYVEREKDRPYRDFHGMEGDARWSALYLWDNGAPVEANAARCPRTVAALERVPMTRISRRTPSVLFSRLEPGTHIPPHHGMLNARLICHLPLIVPAGCWLRVGNETREWQEGKLMIFDDSIEHEAHNPADQLRVVLLFDIWRPELDAAERDAVGAIFAAIDAYGGVPAVA